MQVIPFKKNLPQKRRIKHDGFYKRGKYYSYVYYPQKGGKQKWVCTNQIDKNLARLWVSENIIRPKLNNELNLRIDSKIIFSDFVDKYYWAYALDKNSDSTNQVNIYRIKILEGSFGSIQLKDISFNHIQKYFLKRGSERSRNNPSKIISKCALNRERELLSKIFSLAITHNFVSRNPIKEFPRYNETQFKRAGKVLKEEDFEKLLQCFNQKKSYGTTELLYFSYFLGCRKSSLLDLKWEDCRLDEGKIYLTKTKNKQPQWICIGPFLNDMLKKMKSRIESQYVFCNEKGEKRKSLRSAIETALRKAGLEGYRWHDISRHSAVSRMANNGYNWENIREITGHKTYTAFQNYKHYFDDKKQIEMIENTNSRLINSPSQNV